MTHDGASESSDAPTDARKNEENRRKAVAIIVTALGDVPLGIVRDVAKDPAKMLAKLDERYNSKSTASKISKMAEFVSLHYTERSEDISKHVDKMATLVRTLKAMDLPLNDTMTVGVLIASIKVSKLAPVVAAIKTVSDNEMTWDKVATRLILEWKDLPKNKEETIMTAREKQEQCEFCGRHGHSAQDCKFKKQFLEKWNDGNNSDRDGKKKRTNVRKA